MRFRRLQSALRGFGSLLLLPFRRYVGPLEVEARPRPRVPNNTIVAGSTHAKVLVGLTDVDSWTLADAFSGTLILGSTGSGKSTGSGAAIRRTFLRSGLSGVVLCVKGDEPDEWQRAARAHGREHDIVLFGLGSQKSFDFLNWEFNRPDDGAGLVRNVVSLLLEAASAGFEQVSRTDPYWDQALYEVVSSAVCLLAAATHDRDSGSADISLAGLLSIIRSAPTTRQEVSSRGWREGSACWSYMQSAHRNSSFLPAGLLHDVKRAVEFFLHDYASLNSRTRSVISSSFTAKIAPLLQSPVANLLTGPSDPTVLPDVLERGKILVLNFPVKVLGPTGSLIQSLLKTLVQRWIERRTSSSPVFLWADEAQHFLSKQDPMFLATARSKRAATVYLTQSISSVYAAFGGDEAAADALLSNLNTKIFHQQSDPVTNEYAERLFGRHDKSSMPANSMDLSLGAISIRSDSHEPSVVPASSFTTLQRGGPPTLLTEAYVFAARRWNSTGTNALLVQFAQDFSEIRVSR
ncbi:MAG: type IV secretory system conjugative DNA transfer family protein [Dehalococcoidia bacterium]